MDELPCTGCEDSPLLGPLVAKGGAVCHPCFTKSAEEPTSVTPVYTLADLTDRKNEVVESPFFIL